MSGQKQQNRETQKTCLQLRSSPLLLVSEASRWRGEVRREARGRGCHTAQGQSSYREHFLPGPWPPPTHLPVHHCWPSKQEVGPAHGHPPESSLRSSSVAARSPPWPPTAHLPLHMPLLIAWHGKLNTNEAPVHKQPRLFKSTRWREKRILTVNCNQRSI